MYTFSTSGTFTPTSGQIIAIYTSKVASPLVSGDVSVGDRAGNSNLALITINATNTVHLLDNSGGSWVEVFKRTSEIVGFGNSLDLSGNLILIGVEDFRSNTGKIESWYLDSHLSGQTANTDAQGWLKVTETNQDLYWGDSAGDDFGTNVALYNNKTYVHNSLGVSKVYDIDYKGNLRLHRTATSNKAKIIETNDFCKILESSNSSKYKVFDQNKNTWLGCIYASEEFLQAQATANPAVYSSYSTDVQMAGAYGPIDQITQLDGSALGFKDEGPERTRYYSYATEEYEELPESIVIYNPVSGSFDETWYNETSAPRVILNGINFAHMSEIPIDTVYYNFDIGKMYMDEFTMHNYMDHKYDVDATISSGFVIDLNGTRVYDRIGTNDAIIWASYQPNVNYRSVTPLSGITNSSMTPVEMEFVEQLSGGPWDYQYIERLKGLMRTDAGGAHKSNVYSIEIKNSNLNEAIEDSGARELLHRIVERSVREFAKKVAPAHTQLWKIIWSGT